MQAPNWSRRNESTASEKKKNTTSDKDLGLTLKAVRLDTRIRMQQTTFIHQTPSVVSLLLPFLIPTIGQDSRAGDRQHTQWGVLILGATE